MVGGHHRLDEHEFEQTPGDSEGQGSLIWVPAHSLNSGEAAPEARPAGGALRARLIGRAQPAV